MATETARDLKASGLSSVLGYRDEGPRRWRWPAARQGKGVACLLEDEKLTGGQLGGEGHSGHTAITAYNHWPQMPLVGACGRPAATLTGLVCTTSNPNDP